GITERRMGALHGFAANALAMSRGARLLPPGRREELFERIAKSLQATAMREDGLVNWPVSMESTQRTFVQYCSGAPGVIMCMANLPQNAAVDELLVRAGGLVWAAGPLVKLPVLCHGTPGNGYAFLKLHVR